MRLAQYFAIAALIGFSGAAFAQTQSTPGQLNERGANNPTSGSNLSGSDPMSEGRASAPDAKEDGAMQNRAMQRDMTPEDKAMHQK